MPHTHGSELATAKYNEDLRWEEEIISVSLEVIWRELITIILMQIICRGKGKVIVRLAPIIARYPPSLVTPREAAKLRANKHSNLFPSIFRFKWDFRSRFLTSLQTNNQQHSRKERLMFWIKEFLFCWDVRRKIRLQPGVKQHPDLFVSF